MEIEIELNEKDICKCHHDCEDCVKERELIANDYKKLYNIYKEAQALIHAGYDGSFMGEQVANLFAAVMDMEMTEL